MQVYMHVGAAPHRWRQVPSAEELDAVPLVDEAIVSSAFTSGGLVGASVCECVRALCVCVCVHV
jgi:hypothetical protein